MPETLYGSIKVLSGWAFPSTGFDDSEGLPLIRIRDLGRPTTEVKFKGNYEARYVVEDGDVLIGMDGDFAVQKWSGGPALLNQRVCKVESVSSMLDQNFLYWYLMPHVADIHRKTPQTTVRHLSASSLAKIPVPPISFEEQRRASRVLDTLDTTIRQTEAIIEKLKQVKQGLLHDLLTRGIADNGELRPPQSEAPQLYKKSALGWIPKEWDCSNVTDEFNVTSGITLGPHRTPRLYPRKYLRVANVQRAGIDLSDVAELEASDAEITSRRLEPGDLLVVEGHASVEEIGRCAMANEAVRGFTFQNHLFRLRAIRLDHVFGLLWMNSAFVRAYWCKEAATSSGLNTINRAKLARVSVAVPTLVEQQQVAAIAEAMNQRVNSEARQMAKLVSLKSGLMDDLLTGRVRVTPLLQRAPA